MAELKPFAEGAASSDTNDDVRTSVVTSQPQNTRIPPPFSNQDDSQESNSKHDDIKHSADSDTNVQSHSHPHSSLSRTPLTTQPHTHYGPHLPANLDGLVSSIGSSGSAPSPRQHRRQHPHHHHHHEHEDGILLALRTGKVPVCVNVKGPWMDRLPSTGACPPGLEYLQALDALTVRGDPVDHQLVCGWRFSNRYGIYTDAQRLIYYGMEEVPPILTRACPGPDRHYTIVLVDHDDKEVLRIDRDAQCCHWLCCCGCCGCQGCLAHMVSVTAANGQLLGYIHQEGACCSTVLSLRDAEGNKQALVDSPFVITEEFMPNKVNFHVLSIDGSETEVGRITQYHSICGTGYGVDLPYFHVDFPQDLDIRMKAVYLSSVFVLDYIHFEASRRGYNRRYGILKKI